MQTKVTRRLNSDLAQSREDPLVLIFAVKFLWYVQSGRKLPSDMKKLANIFHISKPHLKKAAQALDEFFILTGDHYIYPDYELKIAKKKAFSAKQSDKANLRWRKESSPKHQNQQTSQQSVGEDEFTSIVPPPKGLVEKAYAICAGKVFPNDVEFTAIWLAKQNVTDLELTGLSAKINYRLENFPNDVIRKALVEIFLGDLRKKNQKPIEQQTNNLIEILTGKPQEPPPPILSEEEIVNLEKWAASNFKPLHDLRGRGLHNTINRSTYAFYLQTTSLSHEGKTHA